MFDVGAEDLTVVENVDKADYFIQKKKFYFTFTFKNYVRHMDPARSNDPFLLSLAIPSWLKDMCNIWKHFDNTAVMQLLEFLIGYKGRV